MNLEEKEVIDNLPRFMTLQEAADRLGVSTQTLKRYAKDEKNPFPIIYFSDHTARVPWEQFNIWIDSQMKDTENSTP